MRKLLLAFLFVVFLAVTSQTLRAQGVSIFVSTQGGGQILRVDGNVPNSFSVLSNDPKVTGETLFNPESLLLGFDQRLYIADPKDGEVFRMDQTGNNAELVYNAHSLQTGEPNISPQGLSDFSDSGDLFMTSDGGPETRARGVFEIAGTENAPVGGPFNPPTNIVPGASPANCFANGDLGNGEGTVFDNLGNLFFVIASCDVPVVGEVTNVESGGTQTQSVFVTGNNVNSPTGLAINPQPESLPGVLYVANTNGASILSVDSSGSPTPYYSWSNSLTQCNAGIGTPGTYQDLPTFIKFDSAGNLYVITTTNPDPAAAPAKTACGKVWKLGVPDCMTCTPPATLLLDLQAAFVAGGSPLNSAQAIGLAIAHPRSGTQGQPQSTPSSGPGSLSSSPGHINLGWPQGCTPGNFGDLGTCAHTYAINFGANMFNSGDVVTVVPIETTQSDWSTQFVPGASPYSGTSLATLAGYGGNGVRYLVSCTNSTNGSCATPPQNNYYTTASAWKSTDPAVLNNTWCTTGANGNNPQMLKTEQTASPFTWNGVLVECIDGGPKHIGGSGPTLSGWANVKNAAGIAATVTFNTPSNGAVYTQFSNPLAKYSCGPAAPPPAIAACFAGEDIINGTTNVQNNTPIDTSTLGPHQFQVTADVSSGPGASMPGTPPGGFPPGFTNALVPPSVTYTVVPGAQVSATPANVDFGAFHVPGFGFQFVTVKNIGAAPLSISSVKVTSVSGKDSDDFFALSLCPRTLGAGKSCFILLGFFADEVTANNPQMANLVISATGGSVVVPLSATVVKR
jgi:hypothetical protein